MRNIRNFMINLVLPLIGITIMSIGIIILCEEMGTPDWALLILSFISWIPGFTLLILVRVRSLKKRFGPNWTEALQEN